MNQKIGIIGAGPAGLTAAYKLSKSGHQVELFEAAGQVGGLSRTFELWGQKVDLGPHRFFSADPRVNDVWLEVAGLSPSHLPSPTALLPPPSPLAWQSRRPYALHAGGGCEPYGGARR